MSIAMSSVVDKEPTMDFSSGCWPRESRLCPLALVLNEPFEGSSSTHELVFYALIGLRLVLTL